MRTNDLRNKKFDQVIKKLRANAEIISFGNTGEIAESVDNTEIQAELPSPAQDQETIKPADEHADEILNSVGKSIKTDELVQNLSEATNELHKVVGDEVKMISPFASA